MPGNLLDFQIWRVLKLNVIVILFPGSYVWDLTGPLTGKLATVSSIKNTFNTEWTSPQASVTQSGKTYILKVN